MNVGELVVHLKADSSAVREGVAQAKGPLADFVAEQKKVQKASNETRDVLKKAFAVEVITNQARQVGQALSKMHGEAAQFAGQMTTLTADLVQGWGQGGALGFAIAGISAGIKAVIDEYNAVENAAREASEAAIAGHVAEANAIAAVGAKIREASLGLKALRAAGPFGNVGVEASNIDIASARGRAESAMTGYVAAGGLGDAPTSSAKMFKEQLDKANEDLRLLSVNRSYLDEQLRQERARKDPMTNLRRNDIDSVASRRAVVDGYFAGGPQALQNAQIADFAKRNPSDDGEGNASDQAARRARESAAAFADHTATLNADANAWHAHIQGIADADKAQRAATVAAMDMAESLESSFDSSAMGKLFSNLSGQNTGDSFVFDGDGSGTGYYAGQAALGAAQSAGGGVGMVAGAIAGGPVGLAMMGVQLLAGSKAFDAIQKDVGAALASVGEALGSIIEPLGPAINVITELVEVMANGLAPVFKVLSVVMGPVTEIMRLFGASIAGLWEAFDYLGDYIGHVADIFLNAAMWVSDWFSDNDAERAVVQDRIDAFNPGDLTDRMGEAFDQFMTDTAPGALDDVADAAERVAGALNAPAFYKVATAVMGADAGRYVSGTGQDTQAMTNGAPTRGTVHPGMVSMAGGGVTINGPITVIANDPRAFIEAMRRISMMSNGTPVLP